MNRYKCHVYRFYHGFYSPNCLQKQFPFIYLTLHPFSRMFICVVKRFDFTNLLISTVKIREADIIINANIEQTNVLRKPGIYII